MGLSTRKVNLCVLIDADFLLFSLVRMFAEKKKREEIGNLIRKMSAKRA